MTHSFVFIILRLFCMCQVLLYRIMERDENPLRGLFILTISTHTLTWSVTASRAPRNRSGDFNSHAHVERDRGVDLTRAMRRISTHTLTWSVTIADCKCSVISYISTHTLTWSVTIENLVVPIVSRYFNSHAHVERDVFMIYCP